MSLTASEKTYSSFAEVIWPKIDRKREIALIFAGSWLIALAAQIAIPLYPVPVTGQTLCVLLIGALLGSKRGALTVLVYLTQGAMGLPIFAGGTGGFARIAGPTGGYLIGFVVAAFVVGWLSEKGWNQRFITTGVSMLIGNAVIYIIGLPWLASFIGWEMVFTAGLFPFIPGDLFKVILAAVALPQAWVWVNTRNMK